MTIAICSQGTQLDSASDQRFGRSNYFILVDPETENYEAISNVNAAATGGAGIQTAQLLANRGVDAVLVGNIGPKAVSALNAAGIKVHTGISGTVRNALSQYKEGKLTLSEGATVQPHSGLRGGSIKEEDVQ